MTTTQPTQPSTPSHINAETIRQLGHMTLLSISGGRVIEVNDHTIHLPVARGYVVEVEYDFGTDLYIVRRLHRYGGKLRERGLLSNVDFEQLPEIAYRASCYLQPYPGWS